MKIIWSVLIRIGISLFTGIVFFSLLFEDIAPNFQKISTPLVCPGGSLTQERESGSYMPGESYTSMTWMCSNKSSGILEDVTFKVIFAAGLIYSVFVFGLTYVVTFFVGRRLIKTGKNPFKFNRYEEYGGPGVTYSYDKKKADAMMKEAQELVNSISSANLQNSQANTQYPNLQNLQNMAGFTPQYLSGIPGIPVTPPAPAADPKTRLEELVKLKDSGLISAEEYEQKRQEILSQL